MTEVWCVYIPTLPNYYFAPCNPMKSILFYVVCVCVLICLLFSVPSLEAEIKTTRKGVRFNFLSLFLFHTHEESTNVLFLR